MAKLTPVTLPDSLQVRLQRLYSVKGAGNTAIYKEMVNELHLPLRNKQGTVVDQLVSIMADLLPDIADNIHAS